MPDGDGESAAAAPSADAAPSAAGAKKVVDTPVPADPVSAAPEPAAEGLAAPKTCGMGEERTEEEGVSTSLPARV
jgi:hypothetical protein